MNIITAIIIMFEFVINIVFKQSKRSYFSVNVNLYINSPCKSFLHLSFGHFECFTFAKSIFTCSVNSFIDLASAN